MLLVPRTVAILVAMLLAMTGCRSDRYCLDCPPVGWNSIVPPLECREVEPGEHVPEIRQVPQWDELPTPDIPTTWCALSEETTRELAAARSPLANLLDQEASFVQQQFLAQHFLASQASSAAATVRLAALEQRNRAASQALQVLLRLAEVQGGQQQVSRSLEEVAEMLRDLETLTQQGVTVPVTTEQILTQQLELWAQQSELGIQSQLLSDHLHELLGEQPIPFRQFWPELSLIVEYYELDVDEHLAEAQANRPELRAIRLALGQPPEAVGRLARIILPAAMPGAGLGTASTPFRPRVRQALQRQEGETRRRQLQGLLEYRERVVQREVLDAVQEIDQSYPRIAWAARRLELAESELEFLSQQREVTSGSPIDVRRARLNVYLARQQVLREVIEWKIHLVKLEEAQGRLAGEH